MTAKESTRKADTAAPPGLVRLAAILDAAPPRLRDIPSERAGARPAPGKWSPREELGHLVDSASNNHQRLVRGQLEDRPAMPGYDGVAWVKLHGYQSREWGGIIDLWLAFNRQLLLAARAAKGAAWTRTCTIGGKEPVTLGFVLDDYVDHMVHHLRHIGIDPGV